MKISIEIFCADAKGRGVTASATDVELTLAVTDPVNSDYEGAMTLSDLAKFKLIYVGSPYTLFPGGIAVAYIEICKLMAELLRRGVNGYSPICATHGIAKHGGIDPLDHTIWLPFDQAMMNKADALVIAQMKSWETSKGIGHEIDVFLAAGKPIYFLDPSTLGIEPAPGLRAYARGAN